MKSLPDLLREAYAFDVKRTIRAWNNDGAVGKSITWIDAVRDDTARRKPIDEAVIACVESLERVSTNGEGRGMGWTPAQDARIALAQLRAAVEKGE